MVSETKNTEKPLKPDPIHTHIAIITKIRYASVRSDGFVDIHSASRRAAYTAAIKLNKGTKYIAIVSNIRERQIREVILAKSSIAS